MAHTPLLWLKVSDTGIGMTPDEMARVIHPFQQADISVTRKFGGSGLGLTICRELVTMMHGALFYASAPTRGSIFVVALPSQPVVDPSHHSGGASSGVPLDPRHGLDPRNGLDAGHGLDPRNGLDAGHGLDLRNRMDPRNGLDAGEGLTQPPLPSSLVPSLSLREAAAAGAGPRLTVLVTDDNPLNVRVLTQQLERCGCDVIARSNGLECVEYVQQMLFALAAPGPAAPEQRTDTASPRSHSLRRRPGAASPLPSSTPAAPVRVTETQAAGVRQVDLILMDLHMPVMDGLDATRAIRQLVHPRARTLPIIALTADDPADVGETCRQAGMTSFMRKPVVLSELTAHLARVPRPAAE